MSVKEGKTATLHDNNADGRKVEEKNANEQIFVFQYNLPNSGNPFSTSNCDYPIKLNSKNLFNNSEMISKVGASILDKLSETL